ncbi:MAG TPA: polysaccharide deacetylase family protein [Terriglobales bacterium]|nr:polysaccharide deacetylase family protein [Terriglobales bacterium]
MPFLIRELAQRRRVTILVYHKPAPETADRHFEALRRKYNIISLADYLSYRTDARKHLPPKPLIVTFDDGHESNYALKSILEKHGVRATLFLCSGLVGTNRHFWFETDMSNSVRQRLKRVADDERLGVLSKLGFSETAEYETRQALSASEIEEMKPLVDFQSHTVYHPLLPQCPAPRAATEISDSKIQLEERFRLRIYALAYPNGDYSTRETTAAEASGYTCALTLDNGFNSRETPAFQLRRICINDDAGLAELFVKASGLWGFLKNLAPGHLARRWLPARNTQPEYFTPDQRSAS